MDVIGWRHVMKGLVSKEEVMIQSEWVDVGGCVLSINNWTIRFAVKLPEVTHDQWLYCTMQNHDTTCGAEAAQRKEELQQLVEDQIKL